MKKSRLCFLGGLIGVCVLVWMVNYQKRTGIYMGEAASLVMAASAIMLVAGALNSSSKKRKSYETDPEKERKLAEAYEQLEQLKADSTIVATAIVNSTTIGTQKASAGSSIVRGVAGGAAFGPIGTVAGAVTPKKTLTTETKDVTFSVRYASGRCELEKVKFGSRRYKELARYLA